MVGPSMSISTRQSRPSRSTHTRSGPLTMTSATFGSASKGWSGPSPLARATTSSTTRPSSMGPSRGASLRASSATALAPKPSVVSGWETSRA